MPKNNSQQGSKRDGGQDSAAGQKGVPQATVGSGKKNDPNKFAKDPARAAEAGRKGGRSSHGGS